MLLVRPLLLCFVLLFAGASRARETEPASPELINSEARYLGDLEGPRSGTHRGIYIWRAPSTPAGQLLPTLYMADGRAGLYVAAARLRAAIEAGAAPPIQIIGLDPNPEARDRTSEYTDVGRGPFRAHERWLLDVVIPWAERVARASPEQRAIGGYSNGAAFAIFMGARHPEVFSGVLAHSPVATVETFHVDARAGSVRWALSAGLAEYGGYPARAVSVIEAVVRAAGAAVRSCKGAWGHEANAWMDLSPGAITWLFQAPGADAIATPVEREACNFAGRLSD
ncbi:MAG: alpha/beta hydrolase [Caulobacteraceae bacterium]